MAWKEGYIITSGEYTGELIGVTEYCPESGVASAGDSWIGLSEAYRDQQPSLQFYNTDFTKQIDITSDIEYAGVYGFKKLAAVNIIDVNKNIVGRFCISLEKSAPNTFAILTTIEDADGNFVAYVPRSGTQPTGYQFSVDQTQLKKFYLALCSVTQDNKRVFGWAINGSSIEASGSSWLWGDKQFRGGFLTNEDIPTMYNINGTIAGPKMKSDEYGPESEEGGYGPMDPGSGSTGGSGGPGPTFDGTSDPWVDTPTKPGVLSFGLLNIYKCDTGALINLGRELFPSITWPPTTGVTEWLQWLGSVIEAFSDSIWNKNLIDYIVSVHLIPVDVTGGSLEDIKVGPRTLTGILARPISNDVIEVDCGTVHVDEFYTSYVDYMTRCRVYIPYYGFVTIKPEYWQSADIQLKYLWNVMDGSFIAKLYSTVTRHQSPCKTLIGQYSGCACVHLPLSGTNYANMFSQLAGAAGGMAVGAATGNVAVAASSAMALPGAMGSGGDMQQSNAYNASSAFYGHARPYLIIERPVSHFSTRYNIENGLPLIVTKRIGDCSGLTICDNPILNFACSDEEAKEIITALKEGVII